MADNEFTPSRKLNLTLAPSPTFQSDSPVLLPAKRVPVPPGGVNVASDNGVPRSGHAAPAAYESASAQNAFISAPLCYTQQNVGIAQKAADRQSVRHHQDFAGNLVEMQGRAQPYAQQAFPVHPPPQDGYEMSDYRQDQATSHVQSHGQPPLQGYVPPHPDQANAAFQQRNFANGNQPYAFEEEYLQYANPLLQLSAFCLSSTNSTPQISGRSEAVTACASNVYDANSSQLNRLPHESSSPNGYPLAPHPQPRYPTAQYQQHAQPSVASQFSPSQGSHQYVAVSQDHQVRQFNPPHPPPNFAGYPVKLSLSQSTSPNGFPQVAASQPSMDTRIPLARQPAQLIHHPPLTQEQYQAYISQAISNAVVRERRRSLHGSPTSLLGSPNSDGDENTKFYCNFEFCDKIFDRMSQLRSHAKSHSMERPHTCELCGLKFSRNHDLKRHQRIHGGVRPFLCEHCGKNFLRLDALSRHLKVAGSRGCKGRARESTVTPPAGPAISEQETSKPPTIQASS